MVTNQRSPEFLNERRLHALHDLKLAEWEELGEGKEGVKAAE